VIEAKERAEFRGVVFERLRMSKKLATDERQATP
jgi:hypothetical protein